MYLSDVVGLINDSFYTSDFKITVVGYTRDEKIVMVEYLKEERGDIGRYVYHKPQAKYATIANFDRLYYSKREVKDVVR